LLSDFIESQKENWKSSLSILLRFPVIIVWISKRELKDSSGLSLGLTLLAMWISKRELKVVSTVALTLSALLRNLKKRIERRHPRKEDYLRGYRGVNLKKRIESCSQYARCCSTSRESQKENWKTRFAMGVIPRSMQEGNLKKRIERRRILRSSRVSLLSPNLKKRIESLEL